MNKISSGLLRKKFFQKRSKLIHLYTTLPCLLFLSAGLSAQCENRALSFDGMDDYVSAVTSPISGTGDFTAEMWFTADTPPTGGCNGNTTNKRVLFQFFSNINGSIGGASSLYISECQGELILDHDLIFNSPASSVSVFSLLNPGQWYHLAVVRDDTDLLVYLDCVPIDTIPLSLGSGDFSFQNFELGKDPTPPPLRGLKYWDGNIDEVRVWSVAKDLPELCEGMGCLMQSTTPGLELYYKMDQGIANGNNSSTGSDPVTTIFDATANTNNGALNNFLLLGNNSNIVCSQAAPLYPDYTKLCVIIQDPTVTSIQTQICSGEQVHFSIQDNGVAAQINPGTPVQWEFQDDGGAWQLANSDFDNKYNFLLPNPDTIDCSSNTVGFVDRRYRATLTVVDGIDTCYYRTKPALLQICCKLNNASLQVVTTPVGIVNGTLCESDMVERQVDLFSTHQWVVPPAAGVTIDWSIDGLSDPGLANQTSFAIPTTLVGITDLCVRAEIKSCGKTLIVEECIPVDPKPICATIREKSSNLFNETQDANGNWLYDICHSNDAIISEDVTGSPSTFSNCTPNWEYSFDGVVWDPNGSWLGSSNGTQNTNTIPWNFFWTSGATKVHFRYRCEPESNPSGCDTCYSNEVIINIKSPPAAPVISGPVQVCMGGSVTYTVSPQTPGSVYTWFQNGEELTAGQNIFSITATESGCYWVEEKSSCGNILASNQICLEVCEPVAVISCPLMPNPCATTIPADGGSDIYLTGSNSIVNCAPIVSYQWSANNGTWISAMNISDVQHIPDPSGTTYTLTVTDAFGCTHTASTFIKPCDK